MILLLGLTPDLRLRIRNGILLKSQPTCRPEVMYKVALGYVQSDKSSCHAQPCYAKRHNNAQFLVVHFKADKYITCRTGVDFHYFVFHLNFQYINFHYINHRHVKKLPMHLGEFFHSNIFYATFYYIPTVSICTYPCIKNS